MSGKYIQLNIVTPNGVVYSHRANYVSVVTTMGGLTILPNHLPIVTTLDISQVVVNRYINKKLDNYIAIEGGILEFHNNICNIISNTAERARDINEERAHETKRWAEQEINESQKHNDERRLKLARLALKKSLNRIGVSKRFRK